MNTRHSLLPAVSAVLLSLTLVSCGKGEDPAAKTDNSLLAYVPAETPYLAGNLEPVPEDVIEAAFRRAQPVLDTVQAVLADTSISLSGSAAEEHPELALMGAVLEELDGKLNRQGLESLGFTMEAYQAVYGMGAFPVIRLSLGNAQALRDTIGRIQASSGVEFPQHQHQGQSYWRLSGDNDFGHDGFQAALLFAIIEEEGRAHLAIGLLPDVAEPQLLPAFLGQEKPADTTAAQQLAGLNQKYGYAPYGTGFVDFQRLFDQFADPTSLLNLALAQRGVDLAGEIDEVCRAEIRGLIARAPRMLAGTTEMTPTAMAGQYRLEMADDLANELANLVADVPSAPAVSDRLLEFALGIRIGAARDFLIRKATALSTETFECEALRGLNDSASEALVRLNTPMPPLVNNFLGIRASLSQVPEDESDLSNFKGTLALHVDKPEMFVGMAQMFLPQLEEFQLAKGDPPVRLPESLVPMPGIVAYAAMSDSALGIALGQGEDVRLTDYLEARSSGDGRFFSVNYDMTAYMERIDALSEDLRNAGLGSDDNLQGEFDGAKARSAQAEEIAEAIQEVMKRMAGRSQLSLRFDRHGFAVDSRMEFND